MMKHPIASLFVLFALAVVAQQTPAPKSQLSWVAAQAPEVKRLADALAGEWTTTEKFEADRNGTAGSGAFSLDVVNQGKAERTLTIHASKSGAKP
jgi:hypothetical protein